MLLSCSDTFSPGENLLRHGHNIGCLSTFVVDGLAKDACAKKKHVTDHHDRLDYLYSWLSWPLHFSWPLRCIKSKNKTIIASHRLVTDSPLPRALFDFKLLRRLVS